MPAGPSPACVVTVDGALQVRPPSREIRDETLSAGGGVACGATRASPSAPMRLSGPSPPPLVPKSRYVSTSVPSGRTMALEFWLNVPGSVRFTVGLQVRPLSSDQRTTCSDAVLLPA